MRRADDAKSVRRLLPLHQQRPAASAQHLTTGGDYDDTTGRQGAAPERGRRPLTGWRRRAASTLGRQEAARVGPASLSGGYTRYDGRWRTAATQRATTGHQKCHFLRHHRDTESAISESAVNVPVTKQGGNTKSDFLPACRVVVPVDVSDTMWLYGVRGEGTVVRKW